MRIFIPLKIDVILLKVADLWTLKDLRDTWHKWKNTHKDLNIPRELNLLPLLDHLNSRKIFIQQGEDILKWVHTTTGTFNIQESYFLSAGHRSLPKEEVWGKISGEKLWKTISTFLWLTTHNRILT
jgi:hypothetical protein